MSSALKRADEAGGKMSTHTDSDFRIWERHSVYPQLAAMDGHTFLPYQELTAKAAARFGAAGGLCKHPDSQPGHG